jgi:hypothetical protein
MAPWTMPPFLNTKLFIIENEKMRKMSVERNMEGEQGGNKRNTWGNKGKMLSLLNVDLKHPI